MWPGGKGITEFGIRNVEFGILGFFFRFRIPQFGWGPQAEVGVLTLPG